jgi:hypothetical protein
MEKVYVIGVHIHSKCVPANPANLINLNANSHVHTHNHTQTMTTDLISLHLILLRKERGLEMRSVYLQ